MKSFTKSYGYLLCLTLLIHPIFGQNLAFAREETQAFDSSIMVMAPTSMTNALHEVMKNFGNSVNVSVSGTFEASSEISSMILEGEYANIYITDDFTQMRDLQRLGVINLNSVTNVASDSLVLVIPKGNFLKRKLDRIDSVEEKIAFAAKNVSLVVPDPETEACGKSAQQAFERLGAWDNVTKKMLRAANTRNALYLIANGNNAGIVYNSDAVSNPNVEVLLEIPQKYYDKIIYQASIVAEIGEEANKTDSEKFIGYLKTDEVKATFTKYGFRNL